MGIGGEILKMPQVCTWWPSTNISGLIQATGWFWGGSICICLPLLHTASQRWAIYVYDIYHYCYL
uniref:Uncharacterized protein n=1 Tax=Mola mola TaxID=94237 RepID=A0A3Q3X075_MOLML